MKKKIVFISIAVLCIVLAAVIARFLLIPDESEIPAASDTDVAESTAPETLHSHETGLDSESVPETEFPVYGELTPSLDATICALLSGDIDDFEYRCGVGPGVYEDLRGIEIGDFELYFENFPITDDGSLTFDFPVLKMEVISSESRILPVGTHELVFNEGMYTTFSKKEDFKSNSGPSYDVSDAVRYVYDVGSDRDFESVKKEGLRAFGLVDFIIGRLDCILGGYASRTEEEIKAYAEKYLGVSGDELIFGDRILKLDDGYQMLGRGGSSHVSTIVSEEVRDGITVVTMQFWADHSKFVPSRKVEFHMELVDGEFKPIKTVILEDSELETAFYGC